MIRGRVRGLPHLSSTAWTARFLGMGARLGNHVDIAPQPIVSLATGWCLGVEALSRFPAGAPDAVFAPARGARGTTDTTIIAELLAFAAHLARLTVADTRRDDG